MRYTLSWKTSDCLCNRSPSSKISWKSRETLSFSSWTICCSYSSHHSGYLHRRWANLNAKYQSSSVAFGPAEHYYCTHVVIFTWQFCMAPLCYQHKFGSYDVFNAKSGQVGRSVRFSAIWLLKQLVPLLEHWGVEKQTLHTKSNRRFLNNLTVYGSH